MNKYRPTETEQYRSFQILEELSINGSITQRELSKRFGVALGMVNSYVKNLIAKGYITMKSVQPKRYLYLLTPKGFAEKTRITYHLLQDYTRIYREARNNLKTLFNEPGADGVKEVVFASTDEAAELAYLTLQETDMKLSGVVDNEMAGRKFFGREIKTPQGRRLNEL